jgi:hypothetical protein
MTNATLNPQPNTTLSEHSLSPEGEQFSIPQAHDYRAEFERVEKLVQQARSAGREIVVVMGVGFVGAVMAAIIADTENEKGESTKFVIGCQRPSTRSYWKIPPAQPG